jgi:hypothetical protein
VEWLRVKSSEFKPSITKKKKKKREREGERSEKQIIPNGTILFSG